LLVKGIVSFAKALQIKTIAEYVHNKAIFDLLVEIGVDEF
jgi:EAL domain-containing protein (putative c-di-GMP-specific phosphodiesterase class I)